MPNNVTSGIWRIDTVPFTYSYPVKILNLNISDATAADHVVLNDINGHTVVDFTANASELDYRIGALGWTRGLVLVSLGTTAVITIAVGAGK